MSFDEAEYRRILGHFVTGVTVVATVDPETGAPCGLTANAVASVSLEPPLVLACVERVADSHDCIAESGAFSVNVLDADAERISRRFASQAAERKFAGVAYRTETTGAPVLEHALAWIDCRVWAEYDGGDHTIFVGEVLDGDARDGTPLAYYRGGYGRVMP